MSTDMTLQIVSTSFDATEKLAEQIGRQLRGGEVIELVSDLGGGKTTFVRGLALGMGSTDKVSSPSFTISNEYTGNGNKLIHFDFYRLSDAGLMTHELEDWLGDPNVSIVIEWADIVKQVLPEKRLTINIRILDEDKRQLNFSCPKELSYLLDK